MLYLELGEEVYILLEGGRAEELVHELGDVGREGGSSAKTRVIIRLYGVNQA